MHRTRGRDLNRRPHATTSSCTMGSRAARLAGLVAAVALALPPGGAAAALTLHYDVRYGPLRILSLRTTVGRSTETYRTSSVVETVGVVGVVYPWRSEAVTEGVREPLRPRHHRSDGRYRGQRRWVDITYDDDGAVTTHLEPPAEEDWRVAVPAEQQRATLDPLTASLAAVERACQGRLPVFDGRRRYDLRLEDRGTATVPSSRSLYSGPARRCRAVVEALSGFWRTDPRDSETPTALDFWIASPRADLGALPVYLELSGERGTLRIDLTEIDGQGR